MKMVRLWALRTGCIYPPPLPGNNPGTHFSYRLSQTQGHSAAGRIMSMKNCNETIGNQTRDLPACSAVPQTTAPPYIPCNLCGLYKCTNVSWKSTVSIVNTAEECNTETMANFYHTRRRHTPYYSNHIHYSVNLKCRTKLQKNHYLYGHISSVCKHRANISFV
jgi:hypothetical protein